MKSNFIEHFANLSSITYGINKILIEDITSFLEKNQNNEIKVLDFGCSKKPYKYLFDHCENVIEYVGIDVYDGKFVDIVYDGRDIPFKDQYFDFIFSSSVLEHIEYLDHTLNELNRVLKNGGGSIHAIPFFHHTHGTPFDFNRLTYFGWLSKFNNDYSAVSIRNTDCRLCCLINIITSQINYIIIDLIKLVVKTKNNASKAIAEGDASPENDRSKKLAYLYFVLKLNPINFILGLVCFIISWFPGRKHKEGEITSAYVVKLTK